MDWEAILKFSDTIDKGGAMPRLLFFLWLMYKVIRLFEDVNGLKASIEQYGRIQTDLMARMLHIEGRQLGETIVPESEEETRETKPRKKGSTGSFPIATDPHKKKPS